MPSLEIFNRQRKTRVDLRLFRKFAELAMTKVMERVARSSFPEEIMVVFVSDAQIARIHREFMSVDGPTDVITFRHGEILISVDTADRQREKFSGDLYRELQVYFVHGLLHLSGLDDLTERGFEEMATVQGRIVEEAEKELEAARIGGTGESACEDFTSFVSDGLRFRGGRVAFPPSHNAFSLMKLEGRSAPRTA